MHDRNSRDEVNQVARDAGFVLVEATPGWDVFERRGARIDVVGENPGNGSRLRNVGLISRFFQQVTSFSPDWILVASEDPGQGLLKAAISTRCRVAFLARSSTMLGFGPLTFFPNPSMPGLLAEVQLIICNSNYLASYIRMWSGFCSIVSDIPTYTPQNLRLDVDWKKGFVGIINPCQLKGIEIFEQLASDRPNIDFAFVPSWGTTKEDERRLGTFANVVRLPPRSDVNEIFAKLRVLVVPSLWDEAFGRVVVEAMSCGIPVICSNVGGLPEARLGVDYMISVAPIQNYLKCLDSNAIPVPIVPKQDYEPWIAALDDLLSAESAYSMLSSASFKAAERYVASVNIDTIERQMLSAL